MGGHFFAPPPIAFGIIFSRLLLVSFILCTPAAAWISLSFANLSPTSFGDSGTSPIMRAAVARACGRPFLGGLRRSLCSVEPFGLETSRHSVAPRCRSRVQRTVRLISSSDAMQPSSRGDEGRGGHYRRISFLTDVEGDGAYFDRFVDNSRVLAFRAVEPRFGEGNDAVSPVDDAVGGYFPYDREVIFLDDHEDRIDEADKALLVYGGDVWDKGGSDLYVIRQLLSLKRRYGERVQFLMGNRDINKMRIVPEMGLPGTGQGKESLPQHGGVFWLRGTGLVGDPLDCTDETKVPSVSAADRLRWILGKTMGSPDAFELRRSELERERVTAPASMRGGVPATVSDDDVVESYRTTCHPTLGLMGKYLAEAKLAVRMGDAAFVHGALPLTPEVVEDFLAERVQESAPSQKEASIWSSFDFAMPWRVGGGRERTVVSPNEWISSLNEFARAGVSAWEKKFSGSNSDESLTDADIWSTLGGYRTSCNEETFHGSLLQYGMGWTPNRRRNPTVVYASWSDDGMPRRFYDNDQSAATFRQAVGDFFDSAGINLMVTGHQPNGDIPLPIKLPTDPCSVSEEIEGNAMPRYIIACDTSYSGDTHWINNGDCEKRVNRGRGKSASGRGDFAVSELVINQCPTDGKILGLDVHGVLSDGSSYQCVDLYPSEENVPYSVGTLVNRKDFIFEGSVRDDSSDQMDWWIKAKLADGTYLVSSGKGYQIWNSIAQQRTKN